LTALVLDGELQHSLEFLFLFASDLVIDVRRRWLVGGVKLVVCQIDVSQTLDREAYDGMGRRDGLLVFRLL
jgi:hypothetical protein